MHHWKQSVDGRLVPDVIYIAWLHFLLFQFPENEHGTQKWRFGSDDVPFPNRWFSGSQPFIFQGVTVSFFGCFKFTKVWLTSGCGFTGYPVIHCIICASRISMDSFYIPTWSYLDVSKNRGTPQSSILIGFSINHPFWGTLIFGNTHIPTWSYLGKFPVTSVNPHPCKKNGGLLYNLPPNLGFFAQKNKMRWKKHTTTNESIKT